MFVWFFTKKAPASADKRILPASEYFLKDTRIILAPLKNSSMKYNTQVKFKYSTAMGPPQAPPAFWQVCDTGWLQGWVGW